VDARRHGKRKAVAVVVLSVAADLFQKLVDGRC